MWERVSLEPLAFVWRDFASRAECEGLVARAAAARDFTVASGCQMTYGVEGFRRVMQLNGKTYAEVADDGEVEDDLEPAAASLVRRFDEVVAKLLGTLPGTSQHSMQRVVHCTPRMEGAPAGLLNGLQQAGAGTAADTLRDGLVAILDRAAPIRRKSAPAPDAAPPQDAPRERPLRGDLAHAPAVAMALRGLAQTGTDAAARRR